MTALPHPALHASHSGVWISTQGQTRAVSRGEAIGLASETPVILLNAPLIGQRLGYAELSGLDILELFAFLRPARFAVPTPHGLARAFAYLDVAGDGWLSVPDFEQAILLVMRHVAPRVKKGAEKAGTNIGLDGEGLVVDASCVASLVASLEGSSLTDGKSPPQIDCYAFIQAFEVCDSEGVLS